MGGESDIGTYARTIFVTPRKWSSAFITPRRWSAMAQRVLPRRCWSEAVMAQGRDQIVTTEERRLRESLNFVFLEKIKTSSPILLEVECCSLYARFSNR
jgi:hypothetical protein